jgi:hypothetical protein
MSTVNQKAWTYNTLSTYNQGGFQGLQPPLSAASVSGFYVVPAWPSTPTYNTLIKGGDSGNGYASITYAYGVGAQNCCPSYALSSPCDEVPACYDCPQAPQQDLSCNPYENAPQFNVPYDPCSKKNNSAFRYNVNSACGN